MPRILPLALLAIAGCAEATEPALPLHVQGGALSTGPGAQLDGNDELLPLAPGGVESLWLYEIDDTYGVRAVDADAVDGPDGLVEVTRLEGNHVSLRGGTERDAGWIEITDVEGRTVEQLVRIVPVVAAVAMPGGAWTDGDPQLAGSRFVVLRGGQISVALLAQADDPDFRVLDQGLVAVSPELLPTTQWDAFDVEARAGRHTFEVRTGDATFGFEVDVVEAIDSLEVIPSEPASDGPSRVCFRARAGDAIVTGAQLQFELDGDGDLTRWPNVPANCAQIELRRGTGTLRATLADVTTQIRVRAQ